MRVELIKEQLQLQVESRLFEEHEKGLFEMVGLLGINDDLSGKSKMQRIKSITAGLFRGWRVTGDG